MGCGREERLGAGRASYISSKTSYQEVTVKHSDLEVLDMWQDNCLDFVWGNKVLRPREWPWRRKGKAMHGDFWKSVPFLMKGK